MINGLKITPYNHSKTQFIYFAGAQRPTNMSGNEQSIKKNKPEAAFPFQNPIKPKNKRGLGVLSDLSSSDIDLFTRTAYQKGVSNADLFKASLKALGLEFHVPKVTPVDSRTAQVGNTKVTTLIDGEQIFNKTLEHLKSAESSIQIEMFEFQNLTVDGGVWQTNGAEKVPGAKEQQKILSVLLAKKKSNPDMKIQIILDAHKWYIDGKGDKIKHYGNQDMIRYLKKHGIDVVPYPRGAQQGAVLQHVKSVIVDGKKAVVGGMNWGSHSAANHDACIAIETLPKKKASEVDNLMENFNKDWAFAWQRLGETRVIAGPLNEEEQKIYSGLNKEIKQENVDYHNLVSEFYDTSEARNRYKENRLSLIIPNPVENPKIRVLSTKPKELEFIGEMGEESTREFLMDKIGACKKLRAEVFVLTDKEVVETIIKRHKAGKLDVQILIDGGLIEIFPYCQNAYDKLRENGVPIRIYNADESIKQRLHSKWAVFDDKEIMIGSTNWSAMGLNQNLETGKRADYDLNTKEIDKQIKTLLKEARESEKELGLSEFVWDGSDDCYSKLKHTRAKLRNAIKKLNKEGESGVANVTIDKTTFSFVNDANLTQQSQLQTVLGYYDIIAKRHNAKETYKRGNNEITMVLESVNLAKNVLIKQFGRDWNHSFCKYDDLKKKVLPMRRPLEIITEAAKNLRK